MSKGFRISLAVILVALLVTALLIFPPLYVINIIIGFVFFSLPVLLIVILIKNLFKRPQKNQVETPTRGNWSHTLKITFQFVFMVSLFTALALFVYIFSGLHEGVEGLLPFAILLIISLPSLIIWLIFLLLEKSNNNV